MTQVLRQSTAVDVLIGPFVDLTDAATAETGESPSVKLSKNGQTLAAKNDVTTPVHDADGYYNCELDATDTNTVGTMILTVAASASALPIRHEFQVIEEAVYDKLYAASAALNDLSAADVNAEVDTALADIKLDHLVAVADADDPVDGSIIAEIVSSTGDWSTYVPGTDSLEALANRTGVTGVLLSAASTSAQLVDDVWNEARSGHTTAGTFGEGVASVQGNVTGSVASVTGAVGSVSSGGITAASIATDAVDADALATDAVNEIRDAILPTQNATFNNIPFLFVAASDHVTPVTGATGTAVTRSIDGGTFASGTGTLAEVANGIYQYDASAADMNGGIIVFRFTATGGTPGAPDDAFVRVVTGGGV